MAAKQRSINEDTLWNLIWLLFGGSAMAAGFQVGYLHGDMALMIGTVLISVLISCITSKTMTLLPRKVWYMFGLFKKNKTAPSTTLLSVIDQKDHTRLGVLEVVRGQFHANDRLNILDLYPLRGQREGEGMTVFVVNEKGRETGAGTVVIRNGNFRKDQQLRVESVDVMHQVG